MRSPCPSIAVLTALLAVLLAIRGASAHDAPPLTVTMALDDVELRVGVDLRDDLLGDWAGLRVEALREADAAEEERSIRELERAVASCLSVSVDGVEVSPKVEDVKTVEFDVHGAVWPYALLTVTYGVKGKVRRIDLTWKRWENSIGISVDPLDSELEAYGELDFPIFTEREPGWTWHAPLTPRGPSAGLAAPERMAARVSVPIVSAAIVGALLVGVPVLLLRRVRGRATVGIAVVVLAAAVALSGVARTEVELPWTAGYSPPDEEEARALFAALHRNVYRAFDHTTEDGIYDTLARSVEGDLLDRVYAEVLQSLILREQGGAVCRVRATEILESEVELPEDPGERSFGVVCRWRVTGTVTHYNHRHTRVLEHRARYGLRWRDGGWRIATLDILDPAVVVSIENLRGEGSGK
jgi:hypothetical protein